MNKKTKIIMLRIVTPIIAIAFAVLLSSFLMIAIGKNPLAVYQTMVDFSFGRMDSVAAILFNATPLIFSGLAVAISFKLGLFNIGVEGQYFIGAFCAAFVGFEFTGLPAVIHLPLTIAAGMLGGMLWSLIPIYLKLKRGVHEVISTIMLNYIAYSLLHYLVADVFMDKNQHIPEGVGTPLIRTPYIAPTAVMPKLQALFSLFGVQMPDYVYLNWFFILALVLAAIIYYVIKYTPFGFQLRAVGQNPQAAEASGIKPFNVYMRGFLLSGAIAGLVGLSHLLVYYQYLDLDFPKNLGFNGIAVALMGSNNPLGIVFSAILFGFLSRGGEGIQALLGVPMEIVVIMQGIIILCVVVASNILERYIRIWEKKEV
jgi:simple sugar transport system permease protein